MASRLFVRRFQTAPPATPPVFDFTATGQSRAEEIDNLDGFSITLDGTFVADVVPEVQVGDSAWVPISVALTAPGVTHFPHQVSRVRINVTAFTSGAVNARVSGAERRIGS